MCDVGCNNCIIHSFADDNATVTFRPANGLVTTEAGISATFSMVLDSQPYSAVTLALLSSDSTEGTTSASAVIFTPDNWDILQTATVTGVDDVAVDGDVSYSFQTGFTVASDTNFHGASVAHVNATNIDGGFYVLKRLILCTQMRKHISHAHHLCCA